MNGLYSEWKQSSSNIVFPTSLATMCKISSGRLGLRTYTFGGEDEGLVAGGRFKQGGGSGMGDERGICGW